MQGAALLRQGIQMSAASERKSYEYVFSDGKPPGLIEDATRIDMLPLVLANGNRLQEDPASGNTWAPLYWFGGGPEPMGTRKYRTTMIVGNGSSGTDRAALVWVGGNDGAGGEGTLNLVYFRIRGQGGFATRIGTKMGPKDSDTNIYRADGVNALVSPGDTIGLEISESGGIYTYTGLKNDTPVSGAVWEDTLGEFGVPGKTWGCGGYGVHSGAWFGSLGAYGMSSQDL